MNHPVLKSNLLTPAGHKIAEAVCIANGNISIERLFNLLGKMTYSIRPAIEPIPVTKRMPEASDCIGRPTEHADAGFCWVWTHSYQRWTLRAVFFPRPYPNPPHVTIPEACSHWLPHWAIPLIIDDSVFIAPD
jgi:hypothetical protein